MTEANSDTSSLTKQRQKQWQKLMVIPLVLHCFYLCFVRQITISFCHCFYLCFVRQTKTMTEDNSNTSSLTKQRQKQWQKLIVIPY